MGFYHILPTSHRLFNPSLAGGAQLDLGPYPILWALLALYHHPDNEGEEPSKIEGSMMKHKETGVDVFSSLTLDFDKLTARANRQCFSLLHTLVHDLSTDVLLEIQ